MAKFSRPQLLPGVSPVEVPPRAVIQSEDVIKRARWRAALRDTADLLLLFVVDVFFVRWPRAHVPLLDRRDSLIVMLVINALVITFVLLSRWIPRWRARRVASTWSSRERKRFQR